MDNINTESNSYREAVQCQEKSAFRDLVIIANLALRNQPIWSGFLWYLAPLSGQYYVHYGSIANPLKIVNISFCSLLFLDLLEFQEHIGIIAWARFDIEEKCAQFESQNRGISMIPRQLKTL